MTLSRGVAEWEALCRVRADGVRVRWGAFCVPGLSVYLDVRPCCVVVCRALACCALGRCKKSLFGALLGIFMAFEFCVIYISVKYLIPFYSGNCCIIKF